MQIVKKQQGMTMIGVIFVLFIIGFFGLLAIRLAPVYLSHYNVVQSIDALKRVDQSATKTGETGAGNLKRRLINQLSINGVTSVTDKDIEIKSQKEAYEVRVVYDVKVKMFGNIDALIHFDNSVTVEKSGS